MQPQKYHKTGSPWNNIHFLGDKQRDEVETNGSSRSYDTATKVDTQNSLLLSQNGEPSLDERGAGPIWSMRDFPPLQSEIPKIDAEAECDSETYVLCPLKLQEATLISSNLYNQFKGASRVTR